MVPAVRGGGGGEDRPAALPAQSPGGVVEAGQADPATGHEKVSRFFFFFFGGGGGICPLFDNTCTSVIFLLVAHSTCTCICWKLLEKDMYEKTCYEIHVYVCIYI